MRFGVFWGDGHGGGDAVVVVEVDEFDAGGGAAGGADGFGVDADDFAELRDDHEFGGVVDELDGGDLADFWGGLHVDDALAASGLEAVAVAIRAFAEAVFAHGEDEAGGEAEFGVEFIELGLDGGVDFGVGARTSWPSGALGVLVKWALLAEESAAPRDDNVSEGVGVPGREAGLSTAESLCDSSGRDDTVLAELRSGRDDTVLAELPSGRDDTARVGEAVAARDESDLGSGRGEAGFVEDVLDLVGDAFEASGLEALLVAGFVGWGDGGADDEVALAEVDAAVAGGGPAHGAEVLLVEADGEAVVGGEEDDLLAVGDFGGDELVVLVDVDGDDAAGHDVREVFEGGLLDGAVAGGEEDVVGLVGEVAGGEDGDDFFAGLEATSEAMALPLPAAPMSGIS